MTESKPLVVLTIDVGGTHVKFLTSNGSERRAFDSGPVLTGEQMVAGVIQGTQDWAFDVISIGLPAPVIHGRLIREPHNLGDGWVGFDFESALGKPTKVINDAAMQALGSYGGGRMLFLGLGTGLGTAVIVNGIVEPMEIAHLPYKKNKTYEDFVGLRGLKRLGKKKWREAVSDVVQRLKSALMVDHVVIGGGNAKFLKELPPDTVIRPNADAFLGGFRMWQGSTFQPASSSTTPQERIEV